MTGTLRAGRLGRGGRLSGHHPGRARRRQSQASSSAPTALADHWPRLDAFEGDGYERVLTTVTRTDGTTVQAYVYALSARR